MDISLIKGKCADLWRRYRYAILVLVLGVVLMIIPGKTEDKTDVPTNAPTATQSDMEQRLEEILSQISGAGKVSVMVTEAEGELTLYQQDSDSSGGLDTVIITDGNRNQQGLIQQILPRTYQGVIVVCQGANSASVRLNIIEAVSKVTGLGTDKIVVLKMK